MTNDERIMEAVRAMPGSTSKEIAQLTDIGMSSASARLSVFVKRGLVRREGGQHYPGDGKPIVPKKLRMSSGTKLNQRIIELEEEVLRLKAWQEEAIKKYPDLGVKPEILEARRVVAEVFARHGDKGKINDVMSGKLDESPLMQVALLAAAS